MHDDHAQEGTPGPPQRKGQRRRMLWCDTLKKWMREEKCRGNCGTNDCAAYKDILKRMGERSAEKPKGRFRVPPAPVPETLPAASRAPKETMRTRSKDRGDKARFKLKEE